MKTVVKAWLMVGLFITPLVQAKTVVTSIKPLQLITLEITQTVSSPELLISSSASPHDYALKPSDLKKLKNADLVIWFGPALEPFLEKVLDGSSNSLELAESDLSLRHYDEDEHEDHSGHNHGSYDPHIWLGPIQAKEAAQVIANKLSEIDPENRTVYEKNLQKFNLNIDQSVKETTIKLQPFLQNGYYVFHDAYDYFESYFHLNKLGHFTLSPDRKPGAKTLIQIRSALKKGAANCVFSEPQFKPSTVKSVVRGSNVYVGVLDPLATDIEATKGGYFRFLATLSDSYVECLSYQY